MTEQEKLEALFNLKSAFPTDDEKKAFFRAAADNDRKVLLKTLERWPAAAQNWRDGSGEAVIPSGYAKMKPATLELLLQHGAAIDDVGTPEKRKWPALHTAAFRGEVEQAEMLLRHGATVDLHDEYEQTPLMYAVKQDKLACADLLVLAGADPEYRDRLYRQNAFERSTNDAMRKVLADAVKKRADFLADPTQNPRPPAPEPFVPNPPPEPDPATVKILTRIDLRFKV
jgi:hypothetical protein